jgi:putative NADH-flavin reductase
MKITVIGSTGRTGTHLVADGVRRGHRITAFTRRRNALADRDALAGVVHGDGRDPDAVVQAVTGADAVIAIVGPAGRSGPYHSAEVAQVISTAMQRLHVRRLVVTSAYPLVADTPRLPIAVLRRVFAAAYADAAAMERTVAAGGLDWTIARLNRLTDAAAQRGTRISPDLFTKPTALTRADAAAALLDITESTGHLAAAVNLAGP